MVEITASALGIRAGIQKYAPGQARDNAGRFASGVGGGGANLTRGSQAAADSLYERAKSIEPTITKRMTALADRNGMKLEGLQFRLKQPDSLARKIEMDAKIMRIDPAKAAEGISDSVRYTALIDSSNYTASVANTLDQLRADGYKARVKNFWANGDPYQGINVALTSPEGHGVELQFHTPESLAVKEIIHKDYEAYRVSTSLPERQALWVKMTNEATAVPKPANVESIPELKLQSFQPPVV